MSRQPWFPSIEEVLYFHEIQITLYGGSPGVRDLGLVESAIYNAQQTFGGQELYPSMHEKTAALWHGLVCNHAFVDGNKRVGLMVASIFAAVNDYDIDFPWEEAEAITMALASSQMSRSELSAILAEHMVPKRYSN